MLTITNLKQVGGLYFEKDATGIVHISTTRPTHLGAQRVTIGSIPQPIWTDLVQWLEQQGA